MSANTNEKESCLICFEEFSQDPNSNKCRTYSCCVNGCKQKVCMMCFKTNLDMFYDSNRFVIKFPTCLECDGRIPFKDVKKIYESCKDETRLDKIKFNMRMAIAVRCQGCEEMSSFMVDAESFETRRDMMKALKNCVSSTSNVHFADEFKSISDEFMKGKVNGMKIVNLFSDNKDNFEALENYVDLSKDNYMVPAIASFIPDYERRARLIFDWLRDTKFVATNCCSYNVCCMCQREWHDGESCDTFCGYNENDLDLRSCPNCNVTLERTEGCDSITCYCGEYFNWYDAEAPANSSREEEEEVEEDCEGNADEEEQENEDDCEIGDLFGSDQNMSNANATIAEQVVADEAKEADLDVYIMPLPVISLEVSTSLTKESSVAKDTAVSASAAATPSELEGWRCDEDCSIVEGSSTPASCNDMSVSLMEQSFDSESGNSMMIPSLSLTVTSS